MGIKLTTLTLFVPYKRAGNVISQQPVSFDAYKDDDHYTLVPHLNNDEREVANLPEALRFVVQDGKPVSLRGNKDGNFHLVKDAFQLLQEQNLFA